MRTSSLRGIGPKSARWLADAGVHTRDDLQRLGAVAAFRAVQAAGFTPTLNLLWGLQGLSWTSTGSTCPPSIKAQLRADLEVQDAATT
ncbi:MAG: TfoX/Sxy family DNA transformation protein [Candidatus Latescibacterota bacterium]|nr:TfoX/Sxy family DNA transformation protein [Candidatus Latescibacterota bacterium]